MTRFTISLSAAVALAVLAPATGLAQDADAVRGAEIVGAKTVGAMTYETLGRPTSAADVLRQGGFAVAGAADWTKAAAERSTVAAFHGAGSVGAMQAAAYGLATDSADVRRQGGAPTARTVRWVAVPTGE